MSKKKAFTGSTMTLKDFHGGSIPSDLPLPSAPGVVVRTPDRSALDRQIPATWGNPSNRSDHRSRPGSSNANRNFDDKASFLSHIGRNFDEDERKPLDSFSRRSVPDDDGEDRRRPVRMASNPRLETFSVLSQSNPATEILQGVTNGQISDGSVPNAWAARKELGIGFHQQEQSFKEETRNVSRFASALEKVSSGKWQSKLASATQQQQSGVDVLRFSDSENVNVQQNKTELIYAEGYQSYNLDHANARGDFHVVDHVDVRSDFDIPVIYGDGVRSKEEFLDYERARSPERNRGSHSLEYGNHGSQLNSDKLGGGLQSQLLTQVQERPKFQLVPRTRPLELSESHIMDQKQSYQLSWDPEKPGSAAVDGSNKAAERPKLNLKPRSQPFEQSDKIIIKARYKAGLEELIILKKLVGADPDDKRHCVKFLSSFKYQNIGLKLTAVRAYAKQLFIALKHLRNCGVLHCDIKPDNMLVNEAKNVLKLCDFGNAMFAGKNEITPYLVSRFYRAPEIILGLPYDHPMDVWSVGCCLYELYLGKVLFPGPSNNEMLRLHMELKGPFPKKMLKKGAFCDQHFDQDLNFYATEEDSITKKAVKRLLINIKPKYIGSLISGSPGEDPKMLADFKDLLERIFVLDPEKRMTVSQALNHPFITGK